MNRKYRETVQELHESHSSQTLLTLFAGFGQVSMWLLAGWSWFAGLWPLTIIAWLLAAHLSHMQLMRFHEAAHGMLNENELVNELRGIVIGTFCLVPLSAYRAAHHSHHSYLATERDGELWPFTDPRTSRRFRLAVMIAELALGFLVKPLLFLRVVLVERPSRQQMRRVALEYALCIAYWSLVLAIVVRNGFWEAFLVCYVVPTVLAGCFQTVRLYIEHLGMTGNSPLTLSRTIVPKGIIGRLISWTMLHNDSHGTHHTFAKVPCERIPEATAHVYEVDGYEPKLAVFDSYWHAFLDMLPSLTDPKVGPQWLLEQRPVAALYSDTPAMPNTIRRSALMPVA